MKILAFVGTLLFITASSILAADKPNIIFILGDDIGQGDLGCYGQQKIKTPNLDKMAAEGVRFTQAYSGTTVCAPSRTSLMTGLDMGHSPVRANREIAKGQGQMPLPEKTVTVAQLLKQQGYATACMGKWGMGMFDTTGSPLKKGFDRFYGYNCQRHAHSYFPEYLYNNDKLIDLPENKGGNKKTYADQLIQKNVLAWVEQQGAKPFFLFYATTLPHAQYEIDDLGHYKDMSDWTEQAKAFAAMVTRLDRNIGELVVLLKKMGVDKNTLIIFSGDNGAAFDDKSSIAKFFNQSMDGKLRGFKRGMYEGGLRQAALAYWPGTIPAGRVSEDPWAFWDFLPTCAELAGATYPDGFKPDGLSLVSFLKGGPAPQREYFYWELHEGSFRQAVRFRNWKAVRNGPQGKIELYDLAIDAAEQNDLSEKQPEQVKQAQDLMTKARVDNPNWPIKEQKQAPAKNRKKSKNM
ncbi:MAG: arylsulfatase [bacterium]